MKCPAPYIELIQNADDAGATKVCILLDENTYGTESVLSPAMAPLQGPALLFFNNAVFSESDIRCLARIGQASKLERLATTGTVLDTTSNSSVFTWSYSYPLNAFLLKCISGRFGLGFNAVYHLTDVPSFVSRESIIIFDPHTSYVPGATPSQPGIRIRLQNSGISSFATEFPHQCEPYRFFGCDFNHSFPGTLFRFPLRTEAMASTKSLRSPPSPLLVLSLALP